MTRTGKGIPFDLGNAGEVREYATGKILMVLVKFWSGGFGDIPVPGLVKLAVQNQRRHGDLVHFVHDTPVFETSYDRELRGPVHGHVDGVILIDPGQGVFQVGWEREHAA